MSRKNYKRGTIRFTKKGVRFYYKDNHSFYLDRVILALVICAILLIGIVKLVGFGISQLTKCDCACNQVPELVTANVIVEDVKAEEKEAPKTEEITKKVYKKETVTTEPTTKIVEEPKSLDYRMTYYHPGDDTNSGTCTASGKCTKDFQLNENGWYTYNGKLVVATAHNSLKSWNAYKNSTQLTYNLYDELTLNIDGQDYEAIVLDKCGACMQSAKIDLFVKDNAHGLDTHIKVSK